MDVQWATVEQLLPDPVETRPLGCRRVAPRRRPAVFLGDLDLLRLVTASSLVDTEAILEHQVSDTTLRARRDE